MKEKIIICKIDHPDWGYGRISKFLGIAKNTVKYHLRPEEKEKAAIRCRRFRKSSHPVYRKLMYFCAESRSPSKKLRKLSEPILSMTKVLEQLGPEPRCYLTGTKIDLEKPSTYSFDHRIPISRGGKSTLDNLGLTTFAVNRSKNGYTPEEFLELCKSIVAYNQ